MEERKFDPTHNVNFVKPRSFCEKFKSSLKETFFPDDPFSGFSSEPPKKRLIKGVQYFVPIFEWLPKYSFSLFRYDFLAGITIASLAIPQGISYANLAKVPPVVGLCKYSFSLYYNFFRCQSLYSTISAYVHGSGFSHYSNSGTHLRHDTYSNIWLGYFVEHFSLFVQIGVFKFSNVGDLKWVVKVKWRVRVTYSNWTIKLGARDLVTHGS